MADDDAHIHEVTKLVLRDLKFLGKELEIFSAYSATQGMRIMDTHADIALLLLDMNMESENAGFDLLRYIRKEKKMNSIQVIMRTETSFHELAIKSDKETTFNFYLQKSSLTSTKLRGVILNALQRFHQERSF